MAIRTRNRTKLRYTMARGVWKRRSACFPEPRRNGRQRQNRSRLAGSHGSSNEKSQSLNNEEDWLFISGLAELRLLLVHHYFLERFALLIFSRRAHQTLHLAILLNRSL